MADITVLAEYGPAQAQYMADKRTAVAAGDELAALRADAGWATKQLELRDIADSREAATRSLEQARAEVKTKFPQAPEAAYAHLTDPAAIRQVAEQIHTAIEAQAKAVPEPGGSGWGAAPPSGAAVGAGDPGSDDPDQAFAKRLPVLEAEVRKGLRGDPAMIAEFQNGYLERAVGSRMSPGSKWYGYGFRGEPQR